MATAAALYDLWDSSTYHDHDTEKIILGVSLGLTSVKVCIVNSKSQRILAEVEMDTLADLRNETEPADAKQDVRKIVATLNACVAKLPKNYLQQVTRIGMCGQMHGIVYWRSDPGHRPWDRIERDKIIRYEIIPEEVSPLYTYKDRRCDPAFLSKLPMPCSNLPIFSGYGIPTTFWFHKFKESYLSYYNCCGTIADFAIALLCNLERPVISDQNASSWGYFDCEKNKWNTEILANAGFPTHILPEIKVAGSAAGVLADAWNGIPKGTPIGVGLGDLQCATLATIETHKDAVLYISEGARITFVLQNYKPRSGKPDLGPVQYVPYFNRKFIAKASSRNGGNALNVFVQMIQQWFIELGQSIPQSKVWDALIEVGDDDAAVSDLTVQPTCLGETHAPSLTGSVTNINQNLKLGQVFRAICRGIVQNVHSFMPQIVLQSAKINRILGTGGTLKKNKVLQKEVQEIYELPLVISKGCVPAKGAALAVNLHIK